jgi:hydrogenase-4 component F
VPGVVLALTVLPLVGAAVAVLPRARYAPGVTVTTGVLCLGLALSLVPTAADHPVELGFLRADAISVVFTLGTAFLYAATAVYSVGYLRGEQDRPNAARHARRFWVGVNLFAWSMLCAPLVNGLALLWIAAEVTTVISALLVALDDTRQAAEAAWKYILIASAGLGVALLATIVMYHAGASVLGPSYDLAFTPLLDVAPALPHTAVRLAFGLAVLGFGTKVGLFPVHTWLPDAHSEAPTPVSAMLSGALLAASFYAVLRYYQVTAGALGADFPRTVLLAFGSLSLLLAATYLVRQRSLKRMLAYSSVEHMGILAVGVSFGGPIAFAGVLLHVLAHAAAKGTAFFGAGVLVRTYGTKDIDRIRGAVDRLPWTAPLFLFAILALSAMPPFGPFRSEFAIVAGGLSAGRHGAAAAMVALVTLAFLGLSVATTRMLFVPRVEGPGAAHAPGREPSCWMVVPMVAGIAALLVLGLHPPDVLAELIGRGAAELGGAR